MGNYKAQSGSSKPATSIAKEIQIEFTLDETADTDTSCVSPKTSGASGKCAVGKWMTHPAFQNFGVTGLWVGKFETGNDNGIIVKPNVTSWRNVNVATFFKTSYNYRRDLDSHMMKNTEWGAVAYLSHSKYGINTEVIINNHADYITGYASTDEADQSVSLGTKGTTEDITQPYNTEVGYKASSTGNITGIYDLSGGAWERMASFRSGAYADSGITSADITNYSKYFDLYSNNSVQTSWNNRILGDATGEMGPFYSYKENSGTYYHNNWYADCSTFADDYWSWFGRGSGNADGVIAGQFYFQANRGNAASYGGSRLVLAVK